MKIHFFSPLYIYEERKTASWEIGLHEIQYDDSEWKDAVEYIENEVLSILLPDKLLPRDIPFMLKKERTFKGVSHECDRKEDWENLLKKQQPITIPANTRVVVDVDAGELMTGFLKVKLSGGTNSEIILHQAECYVEEIPAEYTGYGDLPRKGNRADSSKNLLAGNEDKYYLCGKGMQDKPEVYEPFWFRTFRYIRLLIQTKEIPLTIQGFNYLETGYPLEVKTQVETSDPIMKEIWDMSKRTLQRCMQETYTDCPFYEQLQYVMDSRSQILFTYAISADDRLAKRCIDDFGRSQTECGLLQACYPSTGNNIIPGFSIYYIGMIYDHMMYFGEQELVKRNMPVIIRILDYFKGHLNEEGRLLDGPGYKTRYSQHCQVFGVLTDVLSETEGRKNLLCSLREKERYSQCSVAMMYYLFRALEKCDIYNETSSLWDTWKKMLSDKLTTCAEDPLGSRSDCHAWGALVLYEIPSVILGVRPLEPGFAKVDNPIKQKVFSWAKGDVITPRGNISRII